MTVTTYDYDRKTRYKISPKISNTHTQQQARIEVKKNLGSIGD